MTNLTVQQLLRVSSVLEQRTKEGILTRSVDLIPSTFGWKGCSIFLYDHHEDVMRLARTSGIPADSSPLEVIYKSNEGLTGWVFANKRPLIIQDLDKKSNDDLDKLHKGLKWKGKFTENDILRKKAKSFLAVPMISHSGNFIGIIRTTSDSINFSKSELEIFSLFAKYVGMAVDNLEYIRKERRKSNYLELLMKVGTRLLSFFELDDLLAYIAEHTAKTITSETCEIYLRKKEDKNILVLKGGYGIPTNLINRAEHKIGEGLTGTIVKESRMINSQNVLLLPEYKGKYRDAIKDHLKFGDRLTFLGMPIKIKDESIGAIKLYNKIPSSESGKYFTKEDEQYLQILIDMISVAIENVYNVDTMKLSAIKTMKSQRLTALGTLAMRIPNDIVNPLTEVQLAIRNIQSKIKKDGIAAVKNIDQKLKSIQTNLRNVSKDVKIIQEFSTKAGFVHVKRTWKDLLDETLLYLANDIITNKVKVKREEKEEKLIPAISVDPNEIIEVLATIISLAVYKFKHYGSVLKIGTRLNDGNRLETHIIGIDNKDGVGISRKSMGEMFVETTSYGAFKFSLDIVKEIVKSSYHGNIYFNESEEFTRVVLEIPMEK